MGADEPHAGIIGVGHQRSRGVKAGVVTDLDAAEQAVRTTIAEAERMAGVTIEDVHVAVSCGRLTSQSFAAKATIERGVVGDADIARLMAGGRAYAERDGRTLVHLNRLIFRLDGAAGISDPRRMAGRRLVADLHAVSADDAPVRNLMLLVERCFLSVTGLVAAPYASALAATSAEERRLGVTCIDIGGGTTSVAVFANGQFVFADAVPVGGDHVTFDIARALQCPLAEAERIKVLYGTLVIAPSDEHEVFAYPSRERRRVLAQHDEGAARAGGTASRCGSGRAHLRSHGAGVRAHPGNRVVLTGGGSGFVGMREFAMGVLGRPVRVGRPQAVAGLPQSFSSPAFATAVGLHAAAITGSQGIASRRGRDHAPGYFGRVGQWLREGFDAHVGMRQRARAAVRPGQRRQAGKHTMSSNVQLPKLGNLRPRLTVIGVGGAGGNGINNMIATGLSGVEFVVANTDAQALVHSSAEHRIQLGVNLTEGLGAGSRPEIGEAAAEEAIEDIRAGPRARTWSSSPPAWAAARAPALPR